MAKGMYKNGKRVKKIILKKKKPWRKTPGTKLAKRKSKKA